MVGSHMRLQGKSALITGGARGIGAAIAQLFARNGADVVIGDILDEEGRQVEKELNESGSMGLFINMDVSAEMSWQKAIDTVLERFGKLDIRMIHPVLVLIKLKYNYILMNKAQILPKV